MARNEDGSSKLVTDSDEVAEKASGAFVPLHRRQPFKLLQIQVCGGLQGGSVNDETREVSGGRCDMFVCSCHADELNLKIYMSLLDSASIILWCDLEDRVGA